MKLLRSFSLEYAFRYAAIVFIALFSVLGSLCADISIGRSNGYPRNTRRYCPDIRSLWILAYGSMRLEHSFGFIELQTVPFSKVSASFKIDRAFGPFIALRQHARNERLPGRLEAFLRGIRRPVLTKK